MNVYKMSNVTIAENSSMFRTVTADFNAEEPSSFITKEAYGSFAFYSHIIVTPALCIFGIIFNGFGLGVIWPHVKHWKMSIYTYLCALTLSDMIYL